MRGATHRVLHRLVLELQVEHEQQQRLVGDGVVRLRLVAAQADEGGVETLEQGLDCAALEEQRLVRTRGRVRVRVRVGVGVMVRVRIRVW